ncbi:MAG: hypothetical protein WAL25_01980 [Acidimicrobiia bacterium]
MPTTSSDAALRALRGLAEAEVDYAVLHGADKLLSGGISDVDTVVGETPQSILRKARGPWEHHGLYPVVTWPYDIGGTETVFLVDRSVAEGVQLDLLFDPRGLGKYGVRSAPLLATSGGQSIPLISETAGLIYLWRKRTVKGNQDALDELRFAARDVDEDELRSSSEAITGSTRTASELKGETEPAKPGGSHRSVRARRLLDRVLHPIGLWAHVGQRPLAEDLARRLDRVLVIGRAGAVPAGPLELWWYASRIRPTTSRPGVFVSYGRVPRWCPRPDLVVADKTPDEATSALVAYMNSRVYR